jgi:osmotically-inducible protein OsmY
MHHIDGFNVVRSALVVTMSMFVPIVTVRASDDAVKRDIQDTLRADRSLDDSRIIFMSVKDGVVRLSGNAASLEDIVHALRLTADRPGVDRVFSQIGAFEPVSPMNHDAAGVKDALIRLDVQSALESLPGRDSENVHVRVKDGVVRLTGTVPTEEGNSSRAFAAGSVTGVTSVIDELRIVAFNFDAR